MEQRSTYYSILIICVIQSYILFSNLVFADSPSFTLQEIIDGLNDWELWNGKSDSAIIKTHEDKPIEIHKALYKSDCEIFGGYLVPDIESVSYSSDGKILNATIWLSSPFEGTLVNDTIDLYQEELKLSISHAEKTLENYASEKKLQILDPSRFSILEERNNFTLANHTAHKILYTSLKGQNEYKILNIFTVTNGKLYDLIFSSLIDSYSIYEGDLQKILNSLKIYNEENNQSIKKSIDNISNMKKYNNSNIFLNYPSNWNLEENSKDKDFINNISFKAPFEDTELTEPAWQEITYTMAVDINSIHDSGTDYRLILKRDVVKDTKPSWNTEIQEISAFDKNKLIYSSAYDEPINSNHILFSFDLEKINFPKSYKLIFFITNYYVYNHHLCRLIDTTNWVLAPPPEFNISFTPASIQLRPGDNANIEVKVKGNSNIESHLVLAMDHKYDEMIDTKFLPQKTTIPRNGEGTSTLEIEIPENITVKDTVPLSLPIYTNISFPNVVSNRGGDIFYNNKTVSLNDSASLSISVIPPFTWEENLNNFTNTYITPISGLWTFIIGVGTVMIPLIVKLYRRKQRDENYNGKEENKGKNE
ncbi:MAG: hypothetical protein ACM3XP_02770 [Nitrososphaerales archaeon]